MSNVTKVYRVTLMIVDHDCLGPKEIRDVLENTEFPNHCFHPQIVSMEARDVIWDDGHALNKRRTWIDAFFRLFNITQVDTDTKPKDSP